MLHAPAGPARAAAVVCHPHPQYGGDMHNPVVVAAAEALAKAGVAALRFDFGPWSEGVEEQCDVGAAEAALASRVPEGTPLAIVGYSFGAWVGTRAALGLPRATRVVAIGPPLAFFDFDFVTGLRARFDVVVGDRDQYCPRDALARLVAAHPRVRARVISGADHFFAGLDGEVGTTVAGIVVEP